MEFEDGTEAYNSTFEINYDLLLLDVRVPGMSGYDVVKKIRAENNSVPVILITSLTDINNLSIGYEMGCNDYIRKPFELKELRYRIQQILKQIHFSTNADRLKLSHGYCLDLVTYDLYLNEEKIKLTNIERKVVLALSKKLNVYVTTSILIEEAWDDKDAVDTDVRMCIKRIRDKTSKDFIKNQRGLGYAIGTK